jgi:RNA polymerase sigma-70 factor (ECF subfamily)
LVFLLENKEDAKILFTAIGTLPENQQTAFILSKVDGLKNQEIKSRKSCKPSISSIEL